MNRQRGNRRQGVTAKQQIGMLKRQMQGHSNRINHVAPPQITKRPWYPLVVDFIEPTAGVGVFFTPAEIITVLIQQLGLPTQALSALNIKIHRVDVYSMAVASSTDRPACSLDASAVTPSIGDPASPGAAEIFYPIMKRLTDQGNLSEAAKCSYSWPKHMADQPLSSQSIFTLIGSSGNQPNTLTRFHLLWSSTDVAAPK